MFFLKDVCGRESVLFDVRLRKTARRLPVVLDVAEVMAVLDRLDGCFGLMAKIQYGCGLRMKRQGALDPQRARFGFFGRSSDILKMRGETAMICDRFTQVAG